jgi:hypothetical protein
VHHRSPPTGDLCRLSPANPLCGAAAGEIEKLQRKLLETELQEAEQVRFRVHKAFFESS